MMGWHGANRALSCTAKWALHFFPTYASEHQVAGPGQPRHGQSIALSLSLHSAARGARTTGRRDPSYPRYETYGSCSGYGYGKTKSTTAVTKHRNDKRSSNRYLKTREFRISARNEIIGMQCQPAPAETTATDHLVLLPPRPLAGLAVIMAQCVSPQRHIDRHPVHQ